MEEIWKDVVGYNGLYQVSNMGRVKSHHKGKEKILKPGIRRKGYLYVNLYKDEKVKTYSVHRLVLMTFNPVENMKQLEVDHIDTNPSNNNLENLRWTTRKENANNPLTKVRFRESNKGRNNPMYGKRHKEETREKISKANKGKLKGENNPMYGKPRSEETKKKISEANKGENHPRYGKHGAKNPNSIPVVQLTLTGELVEVYEAAKEAKKNGFIPSNVTACNKGKIKTYKGYKWQYLHEYLLLKNPKITELNLFGKTYNQKEVKTNVLYE